MRNHERTLAKVIQNKTGNDNKDPSQTNGCATKVTHVGVKCFTTGDGQKYATKHQQGEAWPFDQHAGTIPRVESVENFEIIKDMNKAHDAENHEPHQGNGCKKRGNTGGSLVLKGEQREDDGQGERHHQWTKPFIDDFQAFHGRQDGHGRRDHRITKEECSADDAQKQNNAALFLEQRFNQHNKRKNATFPLVVGTHQHDHIFKGDDDEQSPDQQRYNTQHRQAKISTRFHNGMQCFAHGIKRAGADIAIDHAQGGKGHFDGILLFVRVTGRGGVIHVSPPPADIERYVARFIVLRLRRGIQQEDPRESRVARLWA